LHYIVHRAVKTELIVTGCVLYKQY